MPAYKDKERGTWYAKFYFEDWTGTKKQKLKRGFSTKREAQEFERDFLSSQIKTCDIKFSDLVNEYLEHIRSRLKATSVQNIEKAIGKHLTPFFGIMPVNTITPNTVRKWQQIMLEKDLKASSLKNYRAHLYRVLNFAVLYYGLDSNPVKKAEPIVGANSRKALAGEDYTNNAKENFWTKEEFDKAMSFVYSDADKMLYYTLFFTGIRIGELLALEVEDYLSDTKQLRICKNMTRAYGKNTITTPKTVSSNRLVYLPQFLCDMLEGYISRIYKATPNTRLFPYDVSTVEYRLTVLCKRNDLKRITIHGFRHSYASLLINKGYDIRFVSEQLGHSSIAMTQNIYSHFYHEKRLEEAKRLDNLE